MASVDRSREPDSSTEKIEPSLNEKANKENSTKDIETYTDHEQDQDTDAVLTTAPWQYKLIALTTALMIPSNVETSSVIILSACLLIILSSIVGSHFSQSAISAMKSTVRTVSISHLI